MLRLLLHVRNGFRSPAANKRKKKCNFLALVGTVKVLLPIQLPYYCSATQLTHCKEQSTGESELSQWAAEPLKQLQYVLLPLCSRSGLDRPFQTTNTPHTHTHSLCPWSIRLRSARQPMMMTPPSVSAVKRAILSNLSCRWTDNVIACWIGACIYWAAPHHAPDALEWS